MGRAPRGFAGVPDTLGFHMDIDELRGRMGEGDALVSNTVLCDHELCYEEANEATFETVLFRGCLLEGVDFSGCTFRDVRFSGCRFIRCSMDRAWLNRVDVVDCSAPGLSLAQARIASTLFSSCDLSYANLSESSIDRLRAVGTRFCEAAMQRAKLKHVELDGCDLTRLDVFGTPLFVIDVSSCTFTAPVLSADYRELRGCTVSPEQALALAELLGVRIAED